MKPGNYCVTCRGHLAPILYVMREKVSSILLAALMVAVFYSNCHSQVLISLLLGDKLNTGMVEFGLDGGLNIVTIDGVDPSSAKPNFNLGFYFDVKLSNPCWMVHTGVLVKSTMGARDIKVYPLDNPDLDDAFKDGTVVRKLGYFNVPLMIKYKWQHGFYVEGGTMLGLMHKARDEFVTSVNSRDDLTHTIDIRDRYHPFDAGLIGGMGYRLMKGNGMNLGIRYYYGLVDTAIDDTSMGQYNRALYFSLSIPVGVGKSSVASDRSSGN